MHGCKNLNVAICKANQTWVIQCFTHPFKLNKTTPCLGAAPTSSLCSTICGLEFKRPHGHEEIHILVGHIGTSLLVLANELLEDLDELALNFASKHFSAGIFLSNLLEFIIVFQEESQVLVGHIHFDVSAKATLVLKLFLPTGICAADLLLDLFGSVCHIDG